MSDLESAFYGLAGCFSLLLVVSLFIHWRRKPRVSESMNQIPKPRITKCRVFKDWYCDGSDIAAMGDTPREAYDRWLGFYKEHLAEEVRKTQRNDYSDYSLL